MSRSYLCPSLTPLLHTEEGRSQQGGEERKEGHSGPAGGGRMEDEMEGWLKWKHSIQCSLTLCVKTLVLNLFKDGVTSYN